MQERLAVEPGIKGLVQPLTEAHAVLWKSLNSFAHAGIHALHRTEFGFPEPLVMDTVKNSNVLAHFAARLMVRTGVPVELHHAVDRARQGLRTAFRRFGRCSDTDGRLRLTRGTTIGGTRQARGGCVGDDERAQHFAVSENYLRLAKPLVHTCSRG